MSAPRNIAAPFQVKEPTGDPTPGTESSTQALGQKDYIDYTNSTFAPLQPVPALTLEKYCGPTPESNWVILDRLLVGAYPASQSDVETFELLISILKLKVSTFVCLQQEYRAHGVTEAMWRSGHALRPYFEDVKLIIKNKAMFKSLAEHPGIVDPHNLDFVHFPIRDCSISDDAAVLKLSQSLVARIDKGERLYLHCWGGHGRTGTVVCIMLHLMYGMTANEAFTYCQRAHDLRQCPVNVGSPQTETQRDQVRRVVAALIQHRKAQALGPPPITMYPPTASPPIVVKQAAALQQTASTLKDVAVITQGTDKMVIGKGAGVPPIQEQQAQTQLTSSNAPPARNNIALRTTQLSVNTAAIPSNMTMIASPPSTPPASASGRRGGRNVTYTVSSDQRMAAKQPSPSNSQQEGSASSPSTDDSAQHDSPPTAVTATSSLPQVRRPGSVGGSRPASPSPLISQKSFQKLEVPQNVVSEPQDEPSGQLKAENPTAATAAVGEVPADQELLKSIPVDLVGGKAVIPHVGLYPMVRMPTERMKNDLDPSPPVSRDEKRRGSRSVAPNLATVSDAMEISKDEYICSRRMSAGTIIAHNIIMNANLEPSPISSASVPLSTPPVTSEGMLKSATGQIMSRMGSSANSTTSEGHTSNSSNSICDNSHQDFSEASAFVKGNSKQSLSQSGDEGTALDSEDADVAMDIDTESGVRPASPVHYTKQVLSNGASTLMGFRR